mmetsp:Transcript_37314/g.119701  ORF Transcript_37314/g.119701 Transcript_37314/m.119701 type:complete len:143 (-) Transcript_37314:210-638(-)
MLGRQGARRLRGLYAFAGTRRLDFADAAAVTRGLLLTRGFAAAQQGSPVDPTSPNGEMSTQAHVARRQTSTIPMQSRALSAAPGIEATPTSTSTKTCSNAGREDFSTTPTGQRNGMQTAEKSELGGHIFSTLMQIIFYAFVI